MVWLGTSITQKNNIKFILWSLRIYKWNVISIDSDNSASECDEGNTYAREPVYDPHRACLHDGVRDAVPLYEPERRAYGSRANENGPFDNYAARDENGSYDKTYEPKDVNGPYDKSYVSKNENRPYDKSYGSKDENGPYDKSYESNTKDENGLYIKERAVGSVGGGSVAHYADYNNINNLSILDMDDDSIKIEARLEVMMICFKYLYLHLFDKY